MKRIEILAPCVCAGRNMGEGAVLDPACFSAADLAVLLGSGLAREVERYEIPEAGKTLVVRDPQPEKKSVKKKGKR